MIIPNCAPNSVWRQASLRSISRGISRGLCSVAFKENRYSGLTDHNQRAEPLLKHTEHHQGEERRRVFESRLIHLCRNRGLRELALICTRFFTGDIIDRENSSGIYDCGVKRLSSYSLEDLQRCSSIISNCDEWNLLKAILARDQALFRYDSEPKGGSLPRALLDLIDRGGEHCDWSK
ncbi:MAG: hypothetical protein MHMPM18_003126 [Marteilia pararefringens]